MKIMFNFPKIPSINIPSINNRSSPLNMASNTGWVKRAFTKNNLLKGIVPNSPGIYILFNSTNKPLYIGHSSVLRHRLQSYYQDDCFKTHSTKRRLRELIKMFAYKVMPLRKAMAVERTIKYKMRYNYK